MMPSKRSLKAYGFLLISIIMLGLLPVALDVGGGQVGTFSFLFYTFLFGSVVTFAILLARRKVSTLKALAKNRKSFWMVVLAGVMSYGLVSVLLTVGTLHTSAGIAGVTYRSWVLFLVLFIPLILKVRVTSYQVVSLLIGFIAVYVALTQGTLITINPSYAPYIILLLIAALTNAVASLIIKKQNSEVGAQVFIFNFFSLLFIAAAMLALGVPLDLYATPLTLASAFLAGGIIWGASAYFYYYALRTLEPTELGNATMLIPFFTFGFAALLLGQQVKLYYLVLAGLVVLGVYIQQKSPKKAPELIQNRKAAGQVQIFDITGAFAETKNSAVYSHIRNGSRALSIIGESGKNYDTLLNDKMAILNKKYDCMFFTTNNPGAHANKDEIEFINEILGLDGRNAALVGIGRSEKVEDALREMDSAYRGEELT